MRFLFIIVAASLVASCSLFEGLFKRGEPKPAPITAEQTANDKCYTVDLFGDHKVSAPGADVPEAMRVFSGEWGGGAWAGEWCHDLYVLRIEPNGDARVVETFGPSQRLGRRAAAFQRRATISPNGELTLSYGATRVSYRVRDGKLYGERREGASAPMEIMLRKGAIYSPVKERLRRQRRG